MTPEEVSPPPVPRDKTKPRPRRGLSLDRLLPTPTRPPLPHAVTIETSRRTPRQRPPLRRSIRLEDEDAAADERRRMFGRGPRAPSFDEGSPSDDDHDECECAHVSLDRSGPSADSYEEEISEPEFATSPPPQPEIVPEFRPHLRGVSSDRALVDRRDRPITPRGPPRTQSQGVFDRRLPRFQKFGIMDRCKRASSSALYDRSERESSPTEEFYNATGSTRLSSQELFEKFCSEDFTSLYGREDDRRRRTLHSKSTGSSGSDVRYERTCCRRTPCGSQPALTRRHLCHLPRSDRSTDSDDTSPRNSVSRPFQIDSQDGDENIDNFSRSAPLLSPDKFEARFTFDISEHSEVTSNRDDTPSDATETRNLTLYEEPHSDRTSLCELYDAAFSSYTPSFRRNGSKGYNGPVDLSALDFRAIDDETPSTSRRPSQRSVNETLRQNSESRSWASDSVFATPEKRFPKTSPSSADTRKYMTAHGDSLTADSAAADTTIADTIVIEEEQASVLERMDSVLTPQTAEFDMDVVGSPIDSGRLGSRPSMHCLEPLQVPQRLNGGHAENEECNLGSMRSKHRRRGASEPRRSAKCVPL